MKMNDKIKKQYSFPAWDDKQGTVYFIGIGGIGMSALARFFKARGFNVSGYDKTPTDLSKRMEKSGISIHYKEDIDLIPKNVDLVIYTQRSVETMKN